MAHLTYPALDTIQWREENWTYYPRINRLNPPLDEASQMIAFLFAIDRSVFGGLEKGQWL
jgi:hypothetical protein